MPSIFRVLLDFYLNLLKQFETYYSKKFAKKENEKLYYIAKTPKEAIDYIEKYKKSEPTLKW